MRILMLVLWMLIPVGALAYHLGPGQSDLKLDRASQLLLDADRYAIDENWASAQALYDQALQLLPEEQTDRRRRVRLERAKAQMLNHQLPEAHADLKLLATDTLSDDQADPELVKEVQSTLANSQYYITWLLRLEGLPREKWEPEITSAQQTYRLLAKQCETEGDEIGLVRFKEDLESSVRLARMDLGELQGLPLPSQ